LPILSLAFNEIKMKFAFTSNIVSKKLYATYIFLDSDERKLITNNPPERRLTLKSMNSFLVETSTGEKQSISLPFEKIGIRDMIISVSSEIEYEEPVVGMNLSIIFNDQCVDRQEMLSGNMLRNVIPLANYGIDENKKRFYFLQFDPTPLEIEPGGILDVNCRRVNKVKLNLMLVPGKYKIDILTRTWNVLEMNHGMANFMSVP
jgi:hypothetical protein